MDTTREPPPKQNRRKIFWMVFLPVTLAVLGWYLNGPVPRGFSRRWALKREMASNKVWTTAVRIADVFGFDYASFSLGGFKNQEQDISLGSANVSVTRDVFDGVGVAIYRPVSSRDEIKEARFGALVYFDGARLTSTHRNEYHKIFQDIVSELGVVIVGLKSASVADPNSKFPRELDDAIAVTKYVLKSAETLGIDQSRVAVGGDSAGGNLAAAVSLQLRDEKFYPQPRTQVLIYPALQAMDFSLPSHVQNRHGPFLDAYSIARFWSMYASGSTKYTSHIMRNDHTTSEAKKHTYNNHIRHEDLVMDYHYKPYRKPKLDTGNPDIWKELKQVVGNPYVSPLLADFSKLPRTFIYTAHYDVLRDEGLLFAQKLKASGSDVTHVHGTKAFHGVLVGRRRYLEGEECFRDVINFLKNNL